MDIALVAPRIALVRRIEKDYSDMAAHLAGNHFVVFDIPAHMIGRVRYRVCLVVVVLVVDSTDWADRTDMAVVMVDSTDWDYYCCQRIRSCLNQTYYHGAT